MFIAVLKIGTFSAKNDVRLIFPNEKLLILANSGDLY